MKSVIKCLSKPSIVMFLRYLAYHKYLFPRVIRYASFRSKSELFNDIKKHFTITCKGLGKDKHILFETKVYTLKIVPVFKFLVKSRQWLVDEKEMIPPSRNRPLFCHIRYGPVVVTFDS